MTENDSKPVPKSISEKTEGEANRDISKLLKREEKINISLGIFLIVSAILTASIFAVVSTVDDGDKDSELKKSSLHIDDVQTLLLSNDTQVYNFDFVVYITNKEKGEAKNVRIELAGIDYKSKLTYSIENETAENIPGERTRELHIKITVPITKNYKIRMMVFEDDIVKIKGYSLVSVETDGKHRDFQVDYDRDTTSYDVEEKEEEEGLSDSTAFVGIIFFLLLLVTILIILGRMDFEIFKSAMVKIGKNLRT